jgi:hypothetical protein
VKSLIFLFGGKLGCFLVYLAVQENAGMTENFMIDYEYQTKKRKSTG